MIERRVLLQTIIFGLAGFALAERVGLAASAAQLPPGLPEEFLKRAAALNYDLNALWATFSQAKASYRSRNLAALWRVCSSPLLVIDEGKRHEVKSLVELHGLAQTVFAPKIRNAVLQCEFASLFLNSQGAMIGDGELWIKEICKDRECRKSKFAVSTIDLFGQRSPAQP